MSGGGPTIYDVAKAAGVAPSTVSRAFARPGLVKTDTAERIRRAADVLGYRAHPMARARTSRRTNMIALVISDITNPFYFGIIEGAQDQARSAGYTIMLAHTQESDLLERESIERAIPAVDGMVLASSRMADSAIRMTAKLRPLVVLNREVADVPSVVTDNLRGVRRATEHLVGLGHTSITYVAGPEASWADGTRWRSLRSAADELGLRVRKVGPFPPTVEGGIEAAAQVAASGGVTAVLAYNDRLAIGLVRGLTALGLAVPTDLSVIGFDNIFGADLVTPGLTTVAAPLRSQGSTAVRNLLAMVRGATPSGQTVVLPTRLLVRGSTGPPSRGR